MSRDTSDDDAGYDRLMDAGFAFARSQCLFAAVELDLFSALESGPLTTGQIGERLGAHPRGLEGLLDCLVALELLRCDSASYANGRDASRYLVRGKPAYLGDWFRLVSDRLYPVWRHLAQAIRTGLPQNEALAAEDYYADLGADNARHRRFVAAMRSLSARPAELIAREFPWMRVKSFIDLGGALSPVGTELLRAHPHLRGGVFELPTVRPFFDEAHPAGSALAFQSGDFFVDPLPAADVYILGHVLHNWNGEEKSRLLGRVFSALTAGGAVIVYECLLDDERRRMLALLDGLNMLLVTRTGEAVTGRRCEQHLRNAGFVDAKTIVNEETVSIVVAYKGRQHSASDAAMDVEQPRNENGRPR